MVALRRVAGPARGASLGQETGLVSGESPGQRACGQRGTRRRHVLGLTHAWTRGSWEPGGPRRATWGQPVCTPAG